MPHTALASGSAILPFTPRAISVSLPTWKDNLGYDEGDKRVTDAMVYGYPRCSMHLSERKVFIQHYPVKEPRKTADGQRNASLGGRGEALDDDGLENDTVATSPSQLPQQPNELCVAESRVSLLGMTLQVMHCLRVHDSEGSELSEDDLYLDPTGMNTIWSAH
ncbi:hypothetical protein PM082_008755 [Marasmius tenuissimus]|nr:hypothetical protein PM082_008755 [Marasmius tenuissimus]